MFEEWHLTSNLEREREREFEGWAGGCSLLCSQVSFIALFLLQGGRPCKLLELDRQLLPFNLNFAYLC